MTMRNYAISIQNTSKPEELRATITEIIEKTNIITKLQI
jgi:hypothetical protein